MNFKGTWRDYQARVREEMDEHFADNRSNIGTSRSTMSVMPSSGAERNLAGIAETPPITGWCFSGAIAQPESP